MPSLTSFPSSDFTLDDTFDDSPDPTPSSSTSLLRKTINSLGKRIKTLLFDDPGEETEKTDFKPKSLYRKCRLERMEERLNM